MVKLTLRQEAIDDLTDIWIYTAETWSENQAEKYYKSIKLACKEIAKTQNLGKHILKLVEIYLGIKSINTLFFTI